jgi:hypothetical protein
MEEPLVSFHSAEGRGHAENTTDKEEPAPQVVFTTVWHVHPQTMEIIKGHEAKSGAEFDNHGFFVIERPP